MTTLTDYDLIDLKKPFNVEDHEFLPKAGGKFTYIQERAICDRLEEVDPAWQFVIVGTPTIQEGQVIVTANMTLKGVTRSGVGMASLMKGATRDDNAEKSAATDALKRCARLFGVGRYLLDCPKWVNDENDLRKWLSDSPVKSAPPETRQVNITDVSHKPKGRITCTTECGLTDVFSSTRVHFQQAGVMGPDELKTEGESIKYTNPYPVATVEQNGNGWKIVAVQSPPPEPVPNDPPPPEPEPEKQPEPAEIPDDLAPEAEYEEMSEDSPLQSGEGLGVRSSTLNALVHAQKIANRETNTTPQQVVEAIEKCYPNTPDFDLTFMQADAANECRKYGYNVEQIEEAIRVNAAAKKFGTAGVLDDALRIAQRLHIDRFLGTVGGAGGSAVESFPMPPA